MKLKIPAIAVLIGVVMLSCYRSPNDTIFADDLDVVITNYQPDLNYADEFLTYAISDSFGIASNVDDIDRDLVNDPVFRANIKEAIMRNMDAYGYQLSKDTLDTPDVYIPVNIIYYNTQGVSWNPIYMPGWGWGWGYPGYGWGGGWSYWGWIPTTYSFDQGTLAIDWLDIKNRRPPIAPDTNWRIDNVWNMNISGLVQGLNEKERNEKLNRAIDIGFEQSPYLDKNN